jgi:hypothetical protein
MGIPDHKPAEKKEDTDKKKDPPYLISGMVRNEQTIIGQGSIFDVPVASSRRDSTT